MSHRQSDEACVVLLAGVNLDPGRIHLPAPAAWCRDPRELLERTRVLQPVAVILDRSAAGEVGALVREIRRAMPCEPIVAVVGEGPGAGDGVESIAADEHAPAELARLVRFARATLRVVLLRSAAATTTAAASSSSASSSWPSPAEARPFAFLGESPSMKRVFSTLDRVAATHVTVLLLGETGTGKELAARALHAGSARADRPFVAVNCAALPENLVESELFGHEPGAFTGATRRKIGRIEQANGGTLFLDEVGDLPPAAQAKLLRALQERTIERIGGGDPIRVDVRLVAATNQDLQAGMAKRNFRRDLFFRLNVVTVTLPPLRDRPEDIPILVDHFLERAQGRMGKRGVRLNDHAREQLLRYPWPGNVRELENLCTRLIALAAAGAVLGPEHLDLFSPDDLEDSPLPSTDLRDILDFCEREIVRRMLDRHGGNRTRTASALGISRQALQQKLARFRGGALGQGSPADEPDATLP